MTPLHILHVGLVEAQESSSSAEADQYTAAIVADHVEVPSIRYCDLKSQLNQTIIEMVMMRTAMSHA